MPEFEQVSFSISQFCARNGISLASYYKLRKANRAPRSMVILNTIRITLEAEKDWQREREAEAAALAGSVEEARKVAHMAELGKRAAASQNFVQRQREREKAARKKAGAR